MMIKNEMMEKSGGIAAWDEGMPLGNGRLGIMLYGTDTVKLALDRIDLWDTRSAPAASESGFCYKTYQLLAHSEIPEEHKCFSHLFDDIYNDTAYPSKIAAGRIELQFTDSFLPDYALSVKTGVATVKDAVGRLRMRIFASATEGIGVLRIWGDYNYILHIPHYISAKEQLSEEVGGICNAFGMGYPEAEYVRESGFTYFRQKTLTAFEYGIVVYEKDCKDCHELYFTITSNNDGENDLIQAKQKLLAAANRGFDCLLVKHKIWWDTYWSKSSVKIPDSNMETVYYRSLYLFGSCSRKGGYPMPLQGVWTADTDRLPPWKGDYHHDTNTQLSYQAYLRANRLDEGEVFLDYLWNCRAAFTAYAKSFFGVDGLLIPGVSTLDGKPMGGWPQYSMSPTMSIWAAQSFDEYYLYTRDKKFLKDRAYPFFSDIGKAIAGLLKEKNGRLYLPLSTSPEIYDNTVKAFLTPNSNFDLALMKYLYQTLIGYAENLGEREMRAYWQSLYQKLDDIAMDEDNRILLAPGQPLETSHRHFSHLMCLYPLHLINYDSEYHKEIYEKNIEEIERLGTGEWVGFSFAMAAQIYAMAGKGNGAYRNLRDFVHGFVGDNGLHLNGDYKHYGYTTYHYRPFTLEALFGYCDALHEMLMQDHMGYLSVFPAIPDEWKTKTLSFTDLRSRGGVLVSAHRTPEGVTKIVCRCDHPQQVRIMNPFVGDCILAAYGNEKVLSADANGIFTFEISDSSPVSLYPVRR